MADLEIALRRDRAYAQLADSHVHRATREDSLSLIKGRDAITAAWVNEDAAEITITADLDEMIAYKVKESLSGQPARGEVPFLAQGESRVAYLENTGKPLEFRPAAAAMSFENF